jgi:hypothetical protein
VLVAVFVGVADSPHLYRIMGEFDNKLISAAGFQLFIKLGLLYT